MTGPIDFNPFKGVNGTESIEQIKDRRQSLRFPEIDLSSVNLNMNQGQDEDGAIAFDNMNLKMNKELPKQK